MVGQEGLLAFPRAFDTAYHQPMRVCALSQQSRAHPGETPTVDSSAQLWSEIRNRGEIGKALGQSITVRWDPSPYRELLFPVKRKVSASTGALPRQHLDSSVNCHLPPMNPVTVLH